MPESPPRVHSTAVAAADPDEETIHSSSATPPLSSVIPPPIGEAATALPPVGDGPVASTAASNTTGSYAQVAGNGPGCTYAPPSASATRVPPGVGHSPVSQPYFWTALPSAFGTTPTRRSFTPWIVGGVLLVAMYLFRDAITLAFVAFALAYVAAPAVRRVERLGVPRAVAIVLVLLGFLSLVAAMVAVLVPELIRQVQLFAASIPEYSRAIQQQWIPWARRTLHLRLPPRTEDAMAQLGLRASAIAPRIGGILNDTLSYSIVVLEGVFTMLIVAATSFYLLMDYDGLLQRTAELVPHSARGRVYALVREIDDTLRHFVNGQLLVMAILGGLYAAGLGLLGVPAGWAIGVFAGLISFVPYLGFFVALGLALVMTALAGRGPAGLLAVTGVMTAVHLLDLTLVTPRIVGGRAKVSPVVVILSLVAGGSVFGFTGVLVAIPVASVLRVLLSHAIEIYKSTGFFLDGVATPDALSSAPFTDSAAGRMSDPPAGFQDIPPITVVQGPVTIAGTGPVRVAVTPAAVTDEEAKTVEEPTKR